MSNLVVSNISDGTTSVGTGYVVNGSAKAWVNFNGTGTIAARDSLNVSSLTDNGAGDYTISYTNNLNATDYCFVGSAEYENAADSVNLFCLKDNGTTYKLASSFRGESFYVNSTVNRTNFDFQQVNLLIHGDLA